MTRCGRCYQETNATIMSKFNTQEICMACLEKERKHPKYPEAVRTEAEAVKRGDLNYPGIGLPSDL